MKTNTCNSNNVGYRKGTQKFRQYQTLKIHLVITSYLAKSWWCKNTYRFFISQSLNIVNVLLLPMTLELIPKSRFQSWQKFHLQKQSFLIDAELLKFQKWNLMITTNKIFQVEKVTQSQRVLVRPNNIFARHWKGLKYLAKEGPQFLLF